MQRSNITYVDDAYERNKPIFSSRKELCIKYNSFYAPFFLKRWKEVLFKWFSISFPESLYLNKVTCLRDLSFFLCARIHACYNCFTLKRQRIQFENVTNVLEAFFVPKTSFGTWSLQYSRHCLSRLFWVAFPFTGCVLLWWNKPRSKIAFL